MTADFLSILILLSFFVYVHGHHRDPPIRKKLHGHQDLCPIVVCENEGDLPEECRKPQFMIGTDGETLCKICDGSYCGRKQDVCPRLLCPDDKNIEPFCRKPNYVIGTDAITRCRVCDTNGCGERKKVCPSVRCPKADKIKRHCRIKQYIMGHDGVTRCRVCDKDACRGSSSAALHNKLVHEHHH